MVVHAEFVEMIHSAYVGRFHGAVLFTATVGRLAWPVLAASAYLPVTRHGVEMYSQALQELSELVRAVTLISLQLGFCSGSIPMPSWRALIQLPRGSRR